MKHSPPHPQKFETEDNSADLAYLQIERYFRRQLSLGLLKEGDKLPSNAELASQFNVSGWTIQNALARLASEGLIERARRRGTFVKAAQQQALIGVLFGPSLAEESAYFYRKILKTLRQEMQAFNWTCRFYDDLTGSNGVPHAVNSPFFQHLLSDFRNYPFKGIIEFATGADELTVLETQSGLPHVRFADNGTDLCFDFLHCGNAVATYLLGKGHRRIGILTATASPKGRVPMRTDEATIRTVLQQAGLPAPEVKCIVLREHAIDQQEASILKQCLAIAESWKAGTFPDALYIDDDIMARSMALALVHLGVRVPEQMELLVLTGAGIDISYGIPVTRYSFSPSELSAKLLDLLWKRIMGKSVGALPLLLAGTILEADGQGSFQLTH